VTSIGWASLEVIPSFDGFGRRLESGVNGPLTRAGVTGGARFGDAAGKSAGARFGSVFKTAAKATLIGVAGAGALAFKVGADAIGAASELNESLNAVTVTYGKQSKAVKKLGRESAKALGLSNSEFNSLTVRFSAFTKTIAGGDGKKVVSTLDDLTTRASDFASVMNLEVADAAALFQSGLAGESEPLRKFGIDLSAASVEAFAYANGIAESGAKLTEAEKVQARYASIMEQTSKTQGDFAKTSDEQANSQRILNARWEDAKAKLGKGLLPIVAEFTEFLIDKGVPAVEDFSAWFNDEGIPAMKKLGEKYGPMVVDTFKGIHDFAKDAVPFVEGIVTSFNDMPGWIKKVLIGGAAGGLAAKKLGLGSLVAGGAKAATGGLLSKGSTPANPLYVLDVGAGLGTGKLGPGSKVVNALGKGGLLAAFGIVTVESAKIDAKNFLDGLSGAGGGGTRGNPFGGEFKGQQQSLTWAQKFGTTLDENQDKIFANKQAIEEFGQSVRTRIPRTISTHYTLLGVNTANEQARQLLETLLQIRSLHNETRLDAAGGSGPTTPSGGKGGGVGATRGVVVNNTFNVNTIRDARLAELHKGRQVSAGGFG
jgi:hypothetical protein